MLSVRHTASNTTSPKGSKMSEFTTPFEMINRTNAIKSHANLEDWNLNENDGSTSITRVDGQVMVADFEVSADLDEHRIDEFRSPLP